MSLCCAPDISYPIFQEPCGSWPRFNNGYYLISYDFYKPEEKKYPKMKSTIFLVAIVDIPENGEESFIMKPDFRLATCEVELRDKLVIENADKLKDVEYEIIIEEQI